MTDVFNLILNGLNNYIMTTQQTETVSKGILEDFPFLIPFVSIMLTIFGFIATFLYFKSSTKSKQKQDAKVDELSVEDRARDKLKDDLAIAKDVKEEARKVAIDTKGEMMDIIHNIVGNISNDIGRNKIILEAELSLMKQNIEQVKVDLKRNIEFQQVINDRMQKSVDFMNQFLWGAGAKSMPPYTQGEEESKEHADKPSEGIFLQPDSSETQQHKDDYPEGTKSADIVKAKKNEIETRNREKETEENKK
jgi:hypothetical protein